MADLQNTLSLDYRDNDEVKSAFAGKQVGDKVTLEIEVQITEMNDEGVQCSIESIQPEDYEPNDENDASKTSDEKGKVMPTSKTPVMVVMGMGGKGKKMMSDDE